MAKMAKSPLTQASGITPAVLEKLNSRYSSTELRSIQSKLTSTAREVRKLGSGGPMGTGLLGRISECLTFDQQQMLRDAAALIESVNSHIEHAKEKRVRDEKATKRRQDTRQAQAKQLIARAFPLPHDTLEQQLEILKAALIFNRVGVFHSFYSPSKHNLQWRERLEVAKTKRISSWPSPQAFMLSHITSARLDLIREFIDEIAYDDGSDVEERLKALKQKIADRLSQIPLTTEEQETLRLWEEALTLGAETGGAA